ncbi:hypothetical protein [Vibrio algarum]|uniref:Uncharacterized protein n=1 Tax=Vibrio algarum TaxID=3020714 RepID=A0ABT4YR66_9VIBR|nr:hypothetical protein [Vibrio sp. KJ40-1]MDB1124046.1 hypothetical protein [Vibrio sp. KJ40-1]
MNLWNLFPTSIANIDYILYMPYAAFAAYVYVFYAIAIHRGYRVKLMFFLALTLVGSINMVLTLGPGIGRVIPPLLLLTVIIFPLVELTKALIAANKKGAQIWMKILIAGSLHSLSWVVWLTAIARS